jgi:hypothetical protein
MLAQFNFMTAGEAYEVELPAGADPVPETTGVFTVGDIARDLTFEPARQRRNPDADPQFVPLFTGTANGRRVTGYRVRQSPPMVAAFWRVKGGFVHTFIDDLVTMPEGCHNTDLVTILKQVVKKISVSESAHGPFVALSDPLGLPDPRESELRDRATFRTRDRAGSWSVLFLRKEPPWARAGKSVKRQDALGEVVVTTAAEIAVVAQGNVERVDELDAHASKAARTLTPLR